MERNTIIIISIIQIIAICALIISILVYTQSINTRGDNFTGKIVDDNGKQIKMNDWLNNDGKDFMKNYIANDINFVHLNDKLIIYVAGKDPNQGFSIKNAFTVKYEDVIMIDQGKSDKFIIKKA
tara:strand:- start:59 stop:430 length:372 start_codon:yes stop_codon:yes gene_type:complete